MPHVPVVAEPKDEVQVRRPKGTSRKDGKEGRQHRQQSAHKQQSSPYRIRVIDYRLVPASELVVSDWNPRSHPDRQRHALQDSLSAVGFAGAELTRLLPDGRLELIDGALRRDEIAAHGGDQPIPCLVTDLSEAEARRVLAEHDAITLLAEYDAGKSVALAELLAGARDRAAVDLLRAAAAVNPGALLLEALADREAQDRRLLHGDMSSPYEPTAWDVDEDEADPIAEEDAEAESCVAGNLVAQFGVPPFTVLDTRQGYWQQRKRAWIASCGLESELGREQIAGANIRFGANSAMRRTLSTDERDFAAGNGDERPALSIFDPALCEVVYRWFSPPVDASVLDPFAGGSVRGIVAVRTGRAYTGIDLRAEQVTANARQWARLASTSSDGRREADATQKGVKPQPDTLLGWMTRLYAVSADEQTLRGEIPGPAVWPMELRAYMELLLLAHAPEVTRFAVADGLIIAPPPATTAAKPRRDDTCLLLFSGGKDSLAAGLRAQRDHGYARIYAVYVRGINRSYPREEDRARAIAERLALRGWTFEVVTPREALPACAGESLIKNQYALALALDALDFVPAAYAFGSFALDDCHTTSWFSDMEAAYRAFDGVLQAVYGVQAQQHALAPRRVPPARDERESVEQWWALTAEMVDPAIREMSASCMLPERYKPQHRARNLAAGVPLDDYQCGSCEKCYLRALLLAASGLPDVPQYPPAYLARARKRLAKALGDPLFCHAHPRLESPLAPGGASARLLADEVYGGGAGINLLPRLTPRLTTATAYEPEVRVCILDGRDGGATPNAVAPRWLCGDSRDLETVLAVDATDYDLLFTCPPYYDLERYSDDPRDLSNAADYETFRADYTSILQAALRRLKPDRFAVLVVGDVRAEQGAGPLLPLVSDTISACCESVPSGDVRLYNDAVMILPTGTLPVRAGRTFRLSRKLGRNHARVLVFVKGDWRRAVAACGGETAVMDWLPVVDEDEMDAADADPKE